MRSDAFQLSICRRIGCWGPSRPASQSKATYLSFSLCDQAVDLFGDLVVKLLIELGDARCRHIGLLRQLELSVIYEIEWEPLALKPSPIARRPVPARAASSKCCRWPPVSNSKVGRCAGSDALCLLPQS